MQLAHLIHCTSYCYITNMYGQDQHHHSIAELVKDARVGLALLYTVSHYQFVYYQLIPKESPLPPTIQGFCQSNFANRLPQPYGGLMYTVQYNLGGVGA